MTVLGVNWNRLCSTISANLHVYRVSDSARWTLPGSTQN